MHFPGEGPANTDTVVRVSIDEARNRGLAHIVFPSCSGATARHFLSANDLRRVCIAHAYGFAEKGKNEMPASVRDELTRSGIVVFAGTHVLSGAERGLSRRFNGINPVEVMAQTLRMFGQGVKVAVEISVMALDAGLIPAEKPVIALGGTGSGLDAAVVLTPAHANAILDTRIHVILCKPV